MAVGNANTLSEYELAHEELVRLYELYWSQAMYFLTFNGALLTVVSALSLLGGTRGILFGVAIIGLSLSVLWLFHSNRNHRHVRNVEECMRQTEATSGFTMKLRTRDQQMLSKKALKEGPFLEKMSGSSIRNLYLPMIMILAWIALIVAVLNGWISPTQLPPVDSNSTRR